MDPSRAIETEGGYKQEGKPIDPASMLDVLSNEPASASDARRAKTLAFVSTVLAAAGGALIGYPLGQKLAAADDPNWTLAYVGGGAIAVAIPLAIWADSSVDSAVQSHNRRLGTDAAALSRGNYAWPAASNGLHRWGVHLVRDPVCYRGAPAVRSEQIDTP